MLSVTQNLLDQLRRDEGLKLKPYRDIVGKLTIGIGRNLDDVGISEPEANYLCGNDANAALDSLAKTFPWVENLDIVRGSVLIAMTFNMGVHALAGFRKFLADMQVGNWAAAAGAMLDSEWARQVGDRATRLSIQVETGEWQ